MEKTGSSDDRSPDPSNFRLWPDADRRHLAATDRSCFKAANQARVALLNGERRLPSYQCLRRMGAFKNLDRWCSVVSSRSEKLKRAICRDLLP